MASALEEREVMLREIHHRVKNNLQITGSLLALQAETTTTEEAKAALHDGVARVRSMALVHQQLYAGRDLARVAIDELIRTLAPLLIASLAPGARLELSLEDVSLSIDQAIPLGLIVNELLTNALKHGRSPDGTVRLRVELARGEGGVAFTVSDGGPGLHAPLATLGRGSLGLQLVTSLARQLSARLGAESDGGAHFRIFIPSSSP
jgi:two-component sensor histidine kinase